jgi:hypothetical protein
MKFSVLPAAAALFAAVVWSATPAHAAGCLSGAAVGGVAGHLAGHHGGIGAAAGCAIGHHEAKKNAAKAQPSQGSGTVSGQPGSNSGH